MAGKETKKMCSKRSQHLPGATILLLVGGDAATAMWEEPASNLTLILKQNLSLGEVILQKRQDKQRCHVGSLPWLCLHGSFRNVSGIYSMVSPRTPIYKHSPFSWLALDCSWGCLCSLLPFMQLNVYRKTLMATFFFLLPLVGPVNTKWCSPALSQI